MILLAAYAVGILVVSPPPTLGGAPPFPHFDKLCHFAEFALFLFLAWQAAGRRLRPAWILSALFAVADELRQAYLPLRDASLLDVLADLAGAGFAALLIHQRALLWRFWRTRILGR